MVSGSAPGKIILFGEHAVVYGRPGIAVPVSQVRAIARVEATPPGNGLTLLALDLGRSVRLRSATMADPLAAIAFLTLAYLEADEPDALLTVTSTIPIAGGLGSGAAVSTAIARGLAAFLGCDLPPAEVSALVYEVEKMYHGTPSGIDNTVVAYERPVYFVRDRRIETFTPGVPFRFLIADSGLPSATGAVVAAVRTAWQAEPARYEGLFDQVGSLADAARQALEVGDAQSLGSLMDRNQALLEEMDLSTPLLDRLIAAARRAGALGAKISGAGRGGNVIALVEEETGTAVEAALTSAGACRVIATTVG